MDQNPEEVQSIGREGGWESGRPDFLMADMLTGWFDEESDELTEQQAHSLIDEWQKGQ
jgi:hypothetical protein